MPSDSPDRLGIPVGGLATGTSDIKSEAEAAVFGGQAGIPHDTCYHATCDKTNNLAHNAFLVNARSVAHVIATAAESTAMIDAEKAVGSVEPEPGLRGLPGSDKVNLDHLRGRHHQER